MSTLKEAFGSYGMTFGMAGEAESFESSVQRPLITTHA